MPDESRQALELDAVGRRFAESTEALSSIREHLRVLAELRQSEETSNARLQEASEYVKGFVAEAAKVLQEMEAAQGKVVEVLKAGADLLDGTELRGIAESVKSNSESLSGVNARVDGLEASLDRLNGMVGEFRAAVEERMVDVAGDIRGLRQELREMRESEAKAAMETASALVTLQNGVDQGIERLDDGIRSVQADVKTPIIVKRFF